MEYDIKEIKKQDRNLNLIREIVKVWEISVKKTHLFLSGGEIENIKAYVPDMLKEIPYLTVVEKDNHIVAFMGVDGRKLEMLFVSPSEIGMGIGRKLMEYGIKKYFVNELCVNEQNPNAKGFYEHMEFGRGT